MVANFQPLWAYADAYVTDLTLPFISRQTASYMYPIRSMHGSGAVVAFGVADLVIVQAGGRVLVCPKGRAAELKRLLAD